MKLLFATAASMTLALAGSSMAHAATVITDPDLSCYPEESQVRLPGEGFTPNAQVNFTRDGVALVANPPIVADAAGQILPTLTLPGLRTGQRTFDYTATDATNTANTDTLNLLVTSTYITLKPRRGQPGRLLTIRARGFFGGGKTLWAHVKRRRGAVRNVKVGRIKGPCKKVKAKQRLFPANPASGKYTVQFDAFRRYKGRRPYEATVPVTVFRTLRPASASAGSSPSWIQID